MEISWIEDNELNSDWIKTLSWDLPVFVEPFLATIGGVEKLDAFMKLPAAEAMPASLRGELLNHEIVQKHLAGRHDQSTHGHGEHHESSSNFKTTPTPDSELGLDNFRLSEYNDLPAPNLNSERATIGIEYYKSDGYREIQNYLRYADMTDASLDITEAARQTYNFDSAFSGNYTPYDTIVTRGQDFGGFFADEQTVLQSIGRSFIEKGYTSTAAMTHNGTAIENRFLDDKPINMTIYVPDGRRGTTLQGFEDSYNHNSAGEAEFVLAKGTTYQVMDAWKDTKTGKLQIKMLVTGQN